MKGSIQVCGQDSRIAAGFRAGKSGKFNRGVIAGIAILLILNFAGAAAAEASTAPEKAEHGLPQNAVEIAQPFHFALTNSMLVSWAIAIGLIVFAQLATRHMQRIPSGAQNFWEWLVEGLAKF